MGISQQEVCRERSWSHGVSSALPSGCHPDAAKAKWWCTELQGRMVDKCLQLHGGYGYINEYTIARLYADARVTRIYGGTTEVMKEVVGRSLRL